MTFQVTSHNFFQTEATSTTPPALEKLQTLYITRSFLLWKEAEILPWLEKQVHIVFNRVDANDYYINECKLKRKKRYKGKIPKNIMRHIIISDLKEVTVDLQGVKYLRFIKNVRIKVQIIYNFINFIGPK